MLSEKDTEASHKATVMAENGVRYTVPQSIDIANMRETVTVRFRVADIYRDRSIAVYYDGKKVMSRRKKVMAPGEMEQVVLKKSSFAAFPELKEIKIRTEVE